MQQRRQVTQIAKGETVIYAGRKYEVLARPMVGDIYTMIRIEGEVLRLKSTATLEVVA